MSPAANLPMASKPEFHAGKALANQPWVKAPSVTDARDGLGPLFNARSCLACHVKGGRGKLPEQSDELLFGPLMRLSVVDERTTHTMRPEPIYGEQLQTNSIGLKHQLRSKTAAASAESSVARLPAEADIYIRWQFETFFYPDGSETELRRPDAKIENLAYGPLHPKLRTSLRNAPAIGGLGLIEAVSDADLLANADPEDSDGDGISGRANWVWDQSVRQKALGRFGLKANRASLLDTVAAAFHSDLGLSNPVYPTQPCSEVQTQCSAYPTGNNKDGFEVPEPLLLLTNDFIRNIGMPKRSSSGAKQSLAGRYLFYQLECSACHKPHFETEAQPEPFAHLGEQRIWPYSNFLLHDMGEGLADHRPDFEASGREWRTAPLWGLALNKKLSGRYYLLHDGRARSVEEAILWHGGEAAKSKDRFAKLTKPDRELLIHFVETL